MTDNIEKIVQEAECVAAADEYFKARTWIMDTNDNRRIFEAGFDRAYALPSKLRAPVADERAAVDPCGYVAVKISAVDWLKDKFPALTIKAGLCERIGGRLYTITRLMRDHDAALASAPVAGESPMAKMADALREKARQEQQAYQDRRNQATEWGPMPDGTEADRPIPSAPVAHIAGDETSRYLEWAKDRSAWEMPVGTPVYYSALASAPVADERAAFAAIAKRRAAEVAAMNIADGHGRFLNAQGHQQAISALDFCVAQFSALPGSLAGGNWRDEFSRRVYEDLAAADNQDVPLEEYPARILGVLDALASAPVAGEAQLSDDDALDILSEHGDHNVEHGRIMFDKWTLRAAGEDLMQRCRAAGSTVGSQGWSGWACQYPGKLPRLYGTREIAGLNCDVENGDRVLFLSEHDTRQDIKMDFSDAYEGAREDLAIWKRRAQVAEQDLRAERETSSRLVAALNAENGPTYMGDAAPQASEAVRDAALEEAASAVEARIGVGDPGIDTQELDRETGTREYPGEGATWVCEMQELEESIRALSAQPGAQSSGNSGELIAHPKQHNDGGADA